MHIDTCTYRCMYMFRMYEHIHMYIYTYIQNKHRYTMYIYICISADVFQSESVLDCIVINQYIAILRFSKHQIIAILCNLPSCSLQSSYTVRV